MKPTTHRVIVLDAEKITACECGLQVGTRPGASTLFAAFAAEHAEIIAA